MSYKNQPYSNVPELREQLMEVWYEQEWGNQANPSIVTKTLQSLKSFVQPSTLLSRLLHPVSNLETTASHQTLKTKTAR